jgi:hypothetical protein
LLLLLMVDHANAGVHGHHDVLDAGRVDDVPAKDGLDEAAPLLLLERHRVDDDLVMRLAGDSDERLLPTGAHEDRRGRDRGGCGSLEQMNG